MILKNLIDSNYKTFEKQILNKIIAKDKELVNPNIIKKLLKNGTFFVNSRNELVYKSPELPSSSDIVKRYIYILCDFKLQIIKVTIKGFLLE